MNLDAWVSRGGAAYLTGVSPDVIGKWKARGWVTADGRRYLTTRRLPSGRLEYLLGDILDAERDTHLSSKSHRRTSAAA